MIRKINCKLCQKEFETHKVRVRYCSKRCATKAKNNWSNNYIKRNRRKIIRFCKKCGMGFIITSGKKYCSVECQYIAQRMRDRRNSRNRYFYKIGPELRERTRVYQSLTDEEKEKELEELRASIMRGDE